MRIHVSITFVALCCVCFALSAKIIKKNEITEHDDNDNERKNRGDDL